MGKNMSTKQKQFNNRIACIAIFAVYAVLTLIGALRHEIWFDEAQAWTIARDNNIAGIFNQLRYEGHPPLWYFILYVFSHLGFECSIMPLIGWLFTAIAAAVVMFKAPFSTVTKSLLIFSGGFLFFNSVMSRTYCMINLFIVLIAVLFPKRKEHPIIFGTLVALLANTHICVSGFIGAIGLIMLHDIYTEWKNNSAKKNTLNLTGLAIAGIGVLMLILPLIGALGSNSSTADDEFTVKRALISFGDSFFNISFSLLNGYLSNHYIFAGILAVAFVILIVLMRHKTRPILILVLSVLFYIITTEIFWITIPNRAHIFLFIYFAVMWIAENEPENKASAIWQKFNPNVDTKLIKKLLDGIKSSDLNFSKSYRVLLSALLICSIPTGAAYLALDYTKPFSLGIAVSEFVTENIPEGSVIVYDIDAPAQIASYLPDYKFYSLEYQDFYTYDPHKIIDEDQSRNGAYNDLKDYPNVYMMKIFPDADAIESNRNIIYSVRECIPFGTNASYIEISTLDVEKELKQ